MPMTKEEKNAKDRARRAAKRAAEAVQPAEAVEPVTDDATVVGEMLDNLPAVYGPIHVEGSFIPNDPESFNQAEALVDELIAAQSGVDRKEHDAVLAMLDQVVQGAADTKGFVQCFASRAKTAGMKDSSIAARKSNLKKVLNFAQESEEFVLRITADQSMGLQAMYALAQEMLKLENGGKDKVDATEPEPTEPESVMSPIEVLLIQLANAQDASANCGFDDITEQLRGIFYAVKAREIEAAALV